ncbi:MAG TPA: glycoside hydrolase domain-containing protein [Bryobacteraceae bacterium]|nr:glycoside hydrolase domain-containing protein [Bryobacteraceae bacterium]
MIRRAFAIFIAIPAYAAFPVWVTSSLERTSPTATPGATKQAELAAAQREYADFEIVLESPASGLTAVRLTPTNLTSASHTIDAANFKLYVEHYVYVDRASPNWHGPNQPLGVGWYPDPLIPLERPFRVAPQRNQPIWVDIYIPDGAAPGDYSGKIQIASDQGEASVPVKLTVYNFALPLAPSLKSVFQAWTPFDEASVEELLRNKVMPQVVKPRDESFLIRKFGLNMTTLGFWSGADNGHCTMKPAPSAGEFRRAKAQQDPSLFLVNYTADEIDQCVNLYPDIQKWAKNMHESGIKNLLVMTPTPQLYGAVDIWAVLPKMYDSAGPRIAEARAHGAEIWSYNTLVQDGYSPKWTIDFDPIDVRLQAGFLSQTLCLTGLLYWRIDKWNNDPWNNVNNSGVYSSNNYPGEGVLVYPGATIGVPGVVASMRLKQIRDGIQDYEYVEILKKLGAGDWAMEQARRIAPDWKNWTRDPAALKSVRRQLGEKIESLTRLTAAER